MESSNNILKNVVSCALSLLRQIKDYLVMAITDEQTDIEAKRLENEKIRQNIDKAMQRRKDLKNYSMQLYTLLNEQINHTKCAYDILTQKVDAYFKMSDRLNFQIKKDIGISRRYLQELLNNNDIELAPYFEVQNLLDHLQGENRDVSKRIEILKGQMESLYYTDGRLRQETEQLQTHLMSVYRELCLSTQEQEYLIQKALEYFSCSSVEEVRERIALYLQKINNASNNV